MIIRSTPRISASAAAWLVGVSLMLFVGYRTVMRDADEMPPINTGAAATTDLLLASTQLQNPSAEIEAALAGVPTNQAIFVIGSDDDPYLTTLHYAISTLAWPRQVGLIRCRTGEPTGITIWTVDVSVTAALVWDPTTVSAAGAPDRAVGPYLRLVKGTEVTDWVSFCSR